MQPLALAGVVFVQSCNELASMNVGTHTIELLNETVVQLQSLRSVRYFNAWLAPLPSRLDEYCASPMR